MQIWIYKNPTTVFTIFVYFPYRISLSIDFRHCIWWSINSQSRCHCSGSTTIGHIPLGFMGKGKTVAMLGTWLSILIFMLNGMRIGSTFGQTQLKVITDSGKHRLLAPSRLVQDFLQQWTLEIKRRKKVRKIFKKKLFIQSNLIRIQTAANTMLVNTAAMMCFTACLTVKHRRTLGGRITASG